MELLCLVGAVLSLGAMLVEALRDSVVFFCLWALYLSMYQVSCCIQRFFSPPRLLLWFPFSYWPCVFIAGGPGIPLLPVVSRDLYISESLVFVNNAIVSWIVSITPQQYLSLCLSRDNLLLEMGFLCILVAPLTIIRGSRGVREHDRVTFWLIRWLLFRLMFASGVVKLTSRCPTWWGLTGVWQTVSVTQMSGSQELNRLPVDPGWVSRISTIFFLWSYRQLWRTTMRLSVSPPRWPGLPTSCRCGGRSWVWWGPSSLRSLHPCSSSARSADSGLAHFICRWAEIQILLFDCFHFSTLASLFIFSLLTNNHLVLWVHCC